MDETTIDLDQTDEDILTDTVSDKALEAAGTERGLHDTRSQSPYTTTVAAELLKTTVVMTGASVAVPASVA